MIQQIHLFWGVDMRRKRSQGILINHRLHEARLQHQWTQQEVADRIGTTVNTVSRWELGIATPGPYFRAKLCALFGQSAQDLGFVPEQSRQGEQPPVSTTPCVAPLPVLSAEQHAPLWAVPYPRNPHFTGRDELFKQLEQHLAPEGASDPTSVRQVALTQPQAIKGLGGIGKTQIAVEYAYRAQEYNRYLYTLWINAAGEEAILASFVTLADLLPGLPAKNETDQRKLVLAIKHWLEQCQQRWLLIFDNADDIALLQHYLPQQGHGSVLLTTRTSAVGALAASLEVENMGIMEGTTFLLHRAQRPQASDEERNEATNVVIALDSFPLALDQAGAYIEETGCSFREYLQLFQKHRLALLARRGKQVTNYPDSVATTWSLAFQKIAQTNPAAADLLHLCAFLAPDHIPEELLKDGAPYWPPMLQQATADPLAFNHLIEDLLTFSLVKRLAGDHLLSIHRLVQAVQIETMEPEQQRLWAERVVCAVNAIFPCHVEEPSSWPGCLRYLEQAQVCDTLIQHYRLLLPEAADLLERTGTYFYHHASYPLAEPLYQRALQMREQLGGSQDLRVASALHHLANLYCMQGKYAEAEPLYQQGLQMHEQQLGAEHPLLIPFLNGLATLYKDQGKYARAEPLYQRALQLGEHQLGPEHLHITRLLNNLAIIYKNQGKYAQAEALYQRALSIREQQLGPEHPDVAFSLNGLANLYYTQRKYAEAEPLYQRVLRLRKQQLGPEHLLVATPLHNLADLCSARGDHGQAESLYQRALAIWERQVGLRHPLAAHSLNGLANLYRDQGKYTEAELLYHQALFIREQALGSSHPDTAETLYDFALLQEAQGKLQEASALYEQALNSGEQGVGSDHAKTAEIRRKCLARLQAMSRKEEAVPESQATLQSVQQDRDRLAAKPENQSREVP